MIITLVGSAYVSWLLLNIIIYKTFWWAEENKGIGKLINKAIRTFFWWDNTKD